MVARTTEYTNPSDAEHSDLVMAPTSGDQRFISEPRTTSDSGRTGSPISKLGTAGAFAPHRAGPIGGGQLGTARCRVCDGSLMPVWWAMLEAKAK